MEVCVPQARPRIGAIVADKPHGYYATCCGDGICPVMQAEGSTPLHDALGSVRQTLDDAGAVLATTNRGAHRRAP